MHVMSRVLRSGDFAHVRPAAVDHNELMFVRKIVIFDLQKSVILLLKSSAQSPV